MVGVQLLGDVLPRDPAAIELFIAVGPEGVTPVPGRYGVDPAGTIRITRPGPLVVGYRSRRASTEQAPAAFAAYVAEEGLDRIAAARTARRQNDRSIREIFSRSAKALLRAGSTAGSHDRVLGFTLELVSEKDPYALRAGDSLPLRLLYDDEPLQDALVVAMNGHDPASNVRARTDRNGRVLLGLPRDGAWLIKAVHMIPAAPGSGADWESFWASLTFELPRAAPAVSLPAR